jgi:hypothetical protein
MDGDNPFSGAERHNAVIHKHKRVQLDFGFPFAGMQLLLLTRHEKIGQPITTSLFILVAMPLESISLSFEHIIFAHLIISFMQK